VFIPLPSSPHCLEIALKNHKLNEKLTNLVAEHKAFVAENEKTKNILLERENKIREIEGEIEERKKEVRKDEIYLEARKSENRKKEQELSSFEEKIIRREKDAEKLKIDSEQAKEKYQTLFDDLERQKESIKGLEEEAKRLNSIATEREATASAIFEKSKVIDDEIKAKEAAFESRREEIESSLKEKIDAYDRKIDDLNNVTEFVDNLKFDNSEDGQTAKIVVKEAIRKAKKSLTDIKTIFDELDEKYCEGTFKGFSTPISEIDKIFKELKTQSEQIKEHIASNEALPQSITKWIDSIDENIIDADKNVKAWEFSEAYRHIVTGLATCKNYELLLTILSEWSSDDTSSNEETETEEEFVDWYEILEIDPNATHQEIKKQWKEMLKKYHPDTAPEENKDEYTQKTILINQAYNVLKNKKTRAQFDEEKRSRKG
jgi:DNA repair exonuclease SbcCD ATPase subunit